MQATYSVRTEKEVASQ